MNVRQTRKALSPLGDHSKAFLFLLRSAEGNAGYVLNKEWGRTGSFAGRVVFIDGDYSRDGAPSRS
jgi:hypothetical protein